MRIEVAVGLVLALSGMARVSGGQCGLRLSAPNPSLIGGSPYALAVADLNHDGHLDVIAAILESSAGPDGIVSILLGRGDGTFQTPRVIQPGGRPWGVAAGDFNGDRNADVVVFAGQLPHNAWVLFGDGVGNLIGQVALVVPAGDASAPESIAAGDFNGDGLDDLAVTSFVHGVSILLSRGDGTFGPIWHNYLTERETPSVCVGDFNGDGRADVALPTGDQLSAEVSVQLDVAGHGLWRRVPLPQSSAWMGSITSADLDGSGRDDIAVLSLEGLSTILCGPNSSFGTPTTYSLSDFSWFVRAGRFDGDNRPDLLVPTAGGVGVYINQGQGAFLPVNVVATPPQYSRWAIGDFNDDGVVDVAGTGFASTNIDVMLNETFQIVSAPSPVQVCPSGSGAFHVGASGRSVTYQWQRETSPFSLQFNNVEDGSSASWDGGMGGAEIQGSQSRTLTIRGVGPGLSTPHAIRYRCVVSDPECGQLETSPVQLAVCTADILCDGFLDFFDYDAFVVAYETGDAVADFNEDGFLDFFDYDAFVIAFETGC